MTDRVFDVEIEFYIPKDVSADVYSSQLRRIFEVEFTNIKTEKRRIPGFWPSPKKSSETVAVSYSVKVAFGIEDVQSTYKYLIESHPEFFPDGRGSVASVKVTDVMAYRSLDND